MRLRQARKKFHRRRLQPEYPRACKQWGFRAFFLDSGFSERRNGHLRATAAPPPLEAGCWADDYFQAWFTLLRPLYTMPFSGLQHACFIRLLFPPVILYYKPKETTISSILRPSTYDRYYCPTCLTNNTGYCCFFWFTIRLWFIFN